MGWYEDGAKRQKEAMKEKQRFSITANGDCIPLNDHARQFLFALKIKQSIKNIGP